MRKYMTEFCVAGFDNILNLQFVAGKFAGWTEMKIRQRLGDIPILIQNQVFPISLFLILVFINL